MVGRSMQDFVESCSFAVVIVICMLPTFLAAQQQAEESAVSFDADSGTQIFKEGKGELYNVCWSSDGKTVAAGDSTGIFLWSFAERKRIDFLKQPMRVFSVAVAPDGKTLASGSGEVESRNNGNWTKADPGIVWLWDIQRRELRHKLDGFKDPIVTVAFSPTGKKLAVGDGHRAVHIVDVSSGKRLLAIDSLGGPIAFVTENTIVARQARTIVVWDIEQSRVIQTFNFPIRYWALMLNVLTLSPDKKLLAATNYSEMRIWKIDTGVEVARILPDKPHENDAESFIFAMAFLPGSQRVAYGGLSQAFTIWDIPSGRKVYAAPDNFTVTRSVSFSPDGKWLAAVSGILWGGEPDCFGGSVWLLPVKETRRSHP